MVLMPRGSVKPTDYYDRPLPPLPRHSVAPDRIASNNPHPPMFRATNAKYGGQPSHPGGHDHRRAPSHSPFPTTAAISPPSTKAPSNTPRTRFLSDIARAPLAALQVNDARVSTSHHIGRSGVECSASLIDECFRIFSDFTILLDACKGQQTHTFNRLSGIFLAAVDKCIRKLDDYPDFVKASSLVVAQRGSVLFAKQLVKNFIDSLPRDVSSDEERREQSARMASLAIMVWDGLRALMRVSYQEELFSTVVKELVSSGRDGKGQSHGRRSDSDEVEAVAALLKKSLVASSADGLKAVKASVVDYFHRLSFARPGLRPRKSQPLDYSVQQADESAARTVFTRRAVDSFILVENKAPKLHDNPNDCKPFDQVLHIGGDERQRRPGPRSGLRNSNIFLTAASTLAVAPSTQAFEMNTFLTQWKRPISPSDYVTDTVRDAVTGKFKEVVSGVTWPALVRMVVDGVDDPDRADLVDAFFLFFRTFSSSSILLDDLILFYHQSSPSDKSLKRVSYRSFRKYGKMQVIKVLRLWLDSNWVERRDHSVRKNLQGLVNRVIAKDTDLAADAAILLLPFMARRDQPEVEPTQPNFHLFPRTAFRPQLKYMESMITSGHDISLVDVVLFQQPGGAEELARGLTILEGDYFNSFSPTDLAGLRSGQEIKQFKEWEQFNTALGWWVLSSILSHKTLEKRMNALELFINVAHICMRNLRNFSSAQAIVQALNHNALTRLRDTVSMITSGHKDRLSQMDDFFWGITEYQLALKTPSPAVPISKISKACVSNAHRRTQSGLRMLDMNYYQGIRRCVRDLTRVHGRLLIPRVKVVLQWIDARCKPYICADQEALKTIIMNKSYAIEPAKRDPLRRKASWVTEEDRKRAFLNGYLP
ncbi:hypothetical protein EIP91_006155 [Steccherinum ochraceum]|uniref:Uncharacterized protein n=1 Tax=Steccherinum ochraceum TaxID=92696 RepID=A0A4R0R8Q8_9APHY|nr:hypothetical protein EIP91_006155 [Steccherinum ochraceum]